jgi:hypothetical protein
MLTDHIAVAIAERDRILIALDVDAAKAWIVQYGGKAPKNVNWPMVLHVARFECESIRASHNRLWWESRIWLAKHGAVSIGNDPDKRACVVALDLIFPKALTDAFIATMHEGQADA